MIRFILKRSTGDGVSPDHESFETFDADVPELERVLKRGGRGAGHDMTHLVGVEIIGATSTTGQK
jgi:hypothetical protein